MDKAGNGLQMFSAIMSLADMGLRGGSSTVQIFPDDDPILINSKAADFLNDIRVLLKDHKKLMPRGDYEVLRIKYRTFRVELSSHKQEDIVVEVRRIKASPILSRLYNGKDTLAVHAAKKFFYQVKAFHKEVVAASHQAQSNDKPEHFPDEGPAARRSRSRRRTKAVHLSPDASRQDLDPEGEPTPPLSQSGSQDSQESLVPPGRFLTTVSSIPTSGAMFGYRRTLILEGFGKRVVTQDLKDHVDEGSYNEQISLRQLEAVAQKELNSAEEEVSCSEAVSVDETMAVLDALAICDNMGSAP